MADRIQLTEENVEDVVGGAFWYWNDENGDFRCKVDNVGVFYASTEATQKLAMYYVQDKSRTVQDIVNYGLSQGLLW